MACTEEAIDDIQPIDVYFKQVDDVMKFSPDGNKLVTVKQILQTEYHTILELGKYIDAHQ